MDTVKTESNRSAGKPESSQNRKWWHFPRRVERVQYVWVVGIFTLIGVMGGYAYYFFIGCNTGGCAITSSPYLSILWGGLLGYLVPDFFVKETPREQ
ncbi:MAG: hypothetical protein R6U62_07930 [Bacteroidales bacterium]